MSIEPNKRPQTERELQLAHQQADKYWGWRVSTEERLDCIKDMTEREARRALAIAQHGTQAIVVVALKNHANRLERQRLGK